MSSNFYILIKYLNARRVTAIEYTDCISEEG